MITRVCETVRQRRRARRILRWIGAVIAVLAVPAYAGDASLSVVKADRSGVVLELTVTDFNVLPDNPGGGSYRRVVLPGLLASSEPGDPQTPFMGTLIGVPEGATVSLQVVESDYKVLHGIRLPPEPIPVYDPDGGAAPGRMVPARESAAYGRNGLLPGNLVEEGYSGYLRDQPVVQILFYPVQFDPRTNEVRVYTHVLVRAAFDNPGGEAAAPGADLPAARGKAAPPSRRPSPFDDMLRHSVINYDALAR